MTKYIPSRPATHSSDPGTHLQTVGRVFAPVCADIRHQFTLVKRLYPRPEAWTDEIRAIDEKLIAAQRKFADLETTSLGLGAMDVGFIQVTALLDTILNDINDVTTVLLQDSGPPHLHIV